jgi:hypothetical protein
MLPQGLEPSIKTMFVDLTAHNFFGCSSSFTEASIQNNLTNPEAVCSDTSGSYIQSPYLLFSVSDASPPTTTFLRTEVPEYAYVGGAPSFSLNFANPDGSLTDRTLLLSAVTKRNSPNMLAVCSNSVASAEVLGPVCSWTLWTSTQYLSIIQGLIFSSFSDLQWFFFFLLLCWVYCLRGRCPMFDITNVYTTSLGPFAFQPDLPDCPSIAHASLKVHSPPEPDCMPSRLGTDTSIDIYRSR